MENMIESSKFYDYRSAVSENFNEAGSEFAISAYNEDIKLFKKELEVGPPVREVFTLKTTCFNRL